MGKLLSPGSGAGWLVEARKPLKGKSMREGYFPRLSDIMTSGEPVKEKKIQDIPRRHKFKNQRHKSHNLHDMQSPLASEKRERKGKKNKIQEEFYRHSRGPLFFFSFSPSFVACWYVGMIGRVGTRVVWCKFHSLTTAQRAFDWSC